MMSSIAIIPARYGSKRVPNKNFRQLGGKPLLTYTVEQALACATLRRIVISTDHPDIHSVLDGFDPDRVIAHQRHPDLGGDRITTEAVLLEVLDQDWAAKTDFVVTLPPTAPFRSARTIDACIELFVSRDADSVLAVSARKIRMGSFDSETQAFAFTLERPPVNMAHWPLTYFDNSSVYVTKSSVLRETGFILGTRNFAVVTDHIEGHDINDPLDWAMAEAMIEKGFVEAR
jgi:N-acylneuraminate cytidylyltransferase